MSAGFVLYDDAIARAAEPFALTRPFGELRAGALVIRQRWARAFGTTATGFIGAPHLSRFTEFGSPPASSGTLAAGTVIVNSRFCPTIDGRLANLEPGQSLRSEGEVAAICVSAAVPVAQLADGTLDLRDLQKQSSTRDVTGWWMQAAWDLVRHLPEMLAADASVLAAAYASIPQKDVSVIGAHRFGVAKGAFIEPRVVIDTTAGDVVVLEGARVGAFARIAGPAVIGAHTLVAGGRYSGISVGEHSRICGEMSVVLITGHSNKGHDGFVGHTAIGRWANLGAGTTTSNLKNSYGKIRVEDSRGEHDTGMQFLGSLIGDHAKTAICTRLNTGTIVGAGANIFGDRSPDKFVPPFAWGDRAPYITYEREKFLDVAAHVMHRRDVELTDAMRHALGAAWDASQVKRLARKKSQKAAKAKSPTRKRS
jgi:UDP-N-acetylglucosamine diphosphorylase/glucosamine-1-phosphate N-acetyltransferase